MKNKIERIVFIIDIVEPDTVCKDALYFKIEIRIGNKIYTQQVMKDIDFFKSYFDIIFDYAKKELKNRIQEGE